MANIAIDGQIWVCAACGKTAKDKYAFADESCFLLAVLCEEHSVVRDENSGLVKSAHVVEKHPAIARKALEEQMTKRQKAAEERRDDQRAVGRIGGDPSSICLASAYRKGWSARRKEEVEEDACNSNGGRRA